MPSRSQLHLRRMPWADWTDSTGFRDPPTRNGISVSGGLSASSVEDTNPDALTITINATDAGGEPLAWSISESLAWASFSPASGTGETSVTVTLDPVGAGLTPGEYEGEFTINAEGAENTPYTGTLSLTVLPPGLYILLEDGSFLLLEDGSGSIQQEDS